MTLFCGVDLAWKDTNKSGVTLLEDTANKPKIHFVDTVLTDKQILGYAKKASIISIDAPLILPEKDKDRKAEQAIQKEYTKKGVGIYPANKAWLKKIGGGRIRGQDLLKNLKQQGYTQRPEKHNSVIEVYPAAIHVELFNLEKPLPYKYKKGRTKKQCHISLLQLQRYINTRIEANIDIVPKETSQTTLKELKKAEDKLDSVLCAYTAYLHSQQKTQIYGNIPTGYIVTPRLKET